MSQIATNRVLALVVKLKDELISWAKLDPSLTKRDRGREQRRELTPELSSLNESYHRSCLKAVGERRAAPISKPVSAVVLTPALTELERRVNVVGVVEDVTDRSYPLGKKQSLKLMLPILLGHELREDYYCMSWVSNRVVTSCLLITTSPLTDS